VQIYEDGVLIHSKVGASDSFAWSNAAPGLHTYFARAVDGLGIPGTSAPVSIFLSAPYAHTIFFPRFVDTNGLILKGHAKLKPYALRVCPATNGPGGMWLTNRQNIRAGFESTFTFQLLNQVNTGGDGLALLIQGAVAPSLGNGGGGLGYSGVTNSVAVELDTWDNPEAADPSSRHISVQSRGRAANSEHHDYSLALNSAIPQFTDGGVHTLRVRYFPGRFDAFIDNLVTPVISLPLDLNEHLYLEGGMAWIGITAAVGFGTQDHDVLSWSVTTFTNQLPTVSITTPTNQTRVMPGGSLSLQASAADTDGSVVRVEYFLGTNSLGFATAPPMRCCGRISPPACTCFGREPPMTGLDPLAQRRCEFTPPRLNNLSRANPTGVTSTMALTPARIGFSALSMIARGRTARRNLATAMATRRPWSMAGRRTIAS
jgi:hypothetical protein